MNGLQCVRCRASFFDADNTGAPCAHDWYPANARLRYMATSTSVPPPKRVPTYAERVAKGRATGRCDYCHRDLTDPESVERGIGPKCEKKHHPDAELRANADNPYVAPNQLATPGGPNAS